MLEALMEKLVSLPPSLSDVGTELESAVMRLEFYKLAKEYLPDDLAAIKRQPLDKALWKFKEKFSEKYFPIYICEDEPSAALADLLHWIPVERMGSEEYDWHDFTGRFGQGGVLLLSIIQCPWGDELKAPIMEEVRNIVGDIVDRIPHGNSNNGYMCEHEWFGWESSELRRRLDGTKYADVAAFAEVMHHDTGVQQIDFSYEDGAENPYWDHEMVDTLAAEWKKGQKIFEQYNAAQKWLEKNPKKHFTELVEFILKWKKPEPKKLAEIFAEGKK